ncbi:hypothetical protein GJR93_09365 [Aminobacter sp. MDW-2]|nr:hypothetical protein [Aminobacter sp. MDW-2]
MAESDIYLCRVCGFDNYPDAPWGADGHMPSNEICPCCGVEFGYDDDGGPDFLSRRRKHWVVANECRWAMPKLKPAQWSAKNQLLSVPVRFLHERDKQLIAGLP